jgi:hypothetical protein
MHQDTLAPLTDRFNLMDFTDTLINDLTLLRSGEISVHEAHVRANLAKQVLKSIHYTIVAQKFMIEQAQLVANPIQIAKPKQKKKKSGANRLS